MTGLATAAISFAIVGWVGYWVPIYDHVEINDRFHAYFYTSEGIARFYWLRADDGFYVDTPDNFVNLEIYRRDDDSFWQRTRHVRPNAIDPMAVVGSRRDRDRRRANAAAAAGGAPASFVQWYGFRTWIWLPIALLAAYPSFVLIRDGRQRRRRNRWRLAGKCEHCGYDLTGLIMARCPECGEQA